MIWAEPPDDRPYSHPDYEPFWAAAQDLNMPLSLHILTARGGTGANQASGKGFSALPSDSSSSDRAFDLRDGLWWCA